MSKVPGITYTKKITEEKAFISMLSHANFRGLEVESSWTTLEGFENFLKDLGYKTDPNQKLIRLSKKRGYFKDNVIWMAWESDLRPTEVNWAGKLLRSLNYRVVNSLGCTGVKVHERYLAKNPECINNLIHDIGTPPTSEYRLRRKDSNDTYYHPGNVEYYLPDPKQSLDDYLQLSDFSFVNSNLAKVIYKQVGFKEQLSLFEIIKIADSYMNPKGVHVMLTHLIDIGVIHEENNYYKLKSKFRESSTGESSVSENNE